MKEIVDLLIFGGQSNMQGQTECLPEPNEPVMGALEYRFLTDELIPLRHPAGEDVAAASGETVLKGAHLGHGSLIPDACRAYLEATGRKAVALHVACGGTCIHEWLRGTERFAVAMAKMKAGIAKAKESYEVGRIAYLWLQGESDAIDGCAGEVYRERMTAFKEDLKKEVGIELFGIIKVGYFCRTVGWLRCRYDEGSGRAVDEIIMEAQEKLAETDPDFVMLTRVCPELSLDPNRINPYEEGHYNNAAMTVIGAEAGKALAEFLYDA